jgi:hypothetical protein
MQRQVAQIKCAIELAADISVFIRKVGEQLSLFENYFRAEFGGVQAHQPGDRFCDKTVQCEVE